MELPGWARDHERSLREEVEPYVDLTPSARLRVLRAATRAAGRILRVRDDAAVALDYIDPLPASSEALLARLRAEAKRSRG